MSLRDKNRTILTDAERRALYDLPDFDEFQRAEYLSLTSEELALAWRREGQSAQLLFAAGLFRCRCVFTFTLKDVPKEDIDFLRERYFSGKLSPQDRCVRQNASPSARRSSSSLRLSPMVGGWQTALG